MKSLQHWKVYNNNNNYNNNGNDNDNDNDNIQKPGFRDDEEYFVV